MKRAGILHAELSGRLARLGHTDYVAVADSGLPVPAGVPVVDLALRRGVIDFPTVLDALVSELVLEAHVIASQTLSSPALAWIDKHADALGERHLVDHEVFKDRLEACRFVIRTGEATAYANVILRCGVPF